MIRQTFPAVEVGASFPAAEVDSLVAAGAVVGSGAAAVAQSKLVMLLVVGPKPCDKLAPVFHFRAPAPKEFEWLTIT